MNIVAIIVTYYPVHKLLHQLIISLTEQVDQIFLVDNGSNEESIGQIEKYSYGLATLIKLNRNVGVAAAQRR